MRLKDKVAIVTGASSGIGKEIALCFAREGATVIAVARRAERLDEIVAKCTSFSGGVIAAQGDVADEAAMDALVDKTLSEQGRIDVLVNNAGVMDDMAPIGETTDETWDKVMRVNLNAPFHLIRKVLPGMSHRRSGAIVNIASLGGVMGVRAGAAYTASKFGLVGLTKNTGFMYAKQGVRCNAICPGAIETEISDAAGNPNEFGLSRLMTGIGANPRLGAPEEIAQVALFLASDDASFVNGAVYVADGGWSAY
jgi:NAD(P)-dependent dehydrogenase (short-subunit alcohol dehydrogenase family)